MQKIIALDTQSLATVAAPVQHLNHPIFLTKPVAVIDIGSNSVRLVIYRWQNGKPTLELNDKKFCELGARLDIAAATGRAAALPAQGKKLALTALASFNRAITAREIPAANIIVVATAAVRAASDGQAFVDTIAKKYGWKIRILNATTEGVLAAYGVRFGLPKAQGIVVDTGGGSTQIINLASLKEGQYQVAALQLGALATLNSLKQRGRAATEDMIAAQMDQIKWLQGRARRQIVCVGGTYRKIAKLYLAEKKSKAKLHGFSVGSVAFKKFLQKLAKIDPVKLDKKFPRRGKAMPGVAMTLLQLMKLTKASKITFSKFGLREGIIYDLSRQQTAFAAQPRNDNSPARKTHAVVRSRDISDALRAQLF
jgi:exopolyphosphatase / guanosine-5'-triphosphate,3'-diphosphate pyrophosphatase